MGYASLEVGPLAGMWAMTADGALSSVPGDPAKIP